MYAATPADVENPPDDCGSGAHSQQHKEQSGFQCPQGRSRRIASNAAGLRDREHYAGEDHYHQEHGGAGKTKLGLHIEPPKWNGGAEQTVKVRTQGTR